MSAQGKNQALAQGAFFAAGMAAAGLLAILVPPSWGLIAGLGLTLGGEALHIFPAAVLGKNILYVSVFLYLIAGLAVTAFYLAKWKVPGLLKFFLLFFAFFYLPLAAAVIALLGIMDSFLNLRRSMEGKK